MCLISCPLIRIIYSSIFLLIFSLREFIAARVIYEILDGVIEEILASVQTIQDTLFTSPWEALPHFIKDSLLSEGQLVTRFHNRFDI
jgi:predicted KAP-like P-loop ATPase